jgi:hypothetical protein
VEGNSSIDKQQGVSRHPRLQANDCDYLSEFLSVTVVFSLAEQKRGLPNELLYDSSSFVSLVNPIDFLYAEEFHSLRRDSSVAFVKWIQWQTNLE